MAIHDTIRSGCVVFDLSSRGKIEAVGTEATAFLHNLATNDVKGLKPGEGCETFFCTSTAKVIGHGWLWRLPSEGKIDRYWLDLDPGCAEKTFQHLDRHLISEDVTLSDRSGEFVQLHLVGAGAEPIVGELGDVVSRRIDRLGMAGFDVLAPASESPSLSDRLLSLGATKGDESAYDWLRVEAGLPTFGADFDESTFVAEIGRTAQAISYQKGCYLGQEPIVMARDRGIVQRTLLGLRLESWVPPGSSIWREGKEVGRTASCVESPRSGHLALAYLKRGSQTPGTTVEVASEEQRRPAIVTALPLGNG